MTTILLPHTANCMVNPNARWELSFVEPGTPGQEEEDVKLCWSQASNNGALPLDRPVYVMGSRDRALVAESGRIYRTDWVVVYPNTGWLPDERNKR